MLDRMKLSTHQYAKSQIKWIRKQLLPAIKEARTSGGEVEVYVLRGGHDGQELATSILHCQYSFAVRAGDTNKRTLMPRSAFLAGERLPDFTEIGHPDSAELLADLAVPDEARVPDIAQ